MSLLDIFVKPVDEAETEKIRENTVKSNKVSDKKQQVTQPAMPSSSPAIPSLTPVQQPSSSVNPDTISTLWEVITNSNIPGPDYLELKDNASALDGMPLTELQKYEAAFNVIKKTSPEFSKAIILSSIDKYIEIVENERSLGTAELSKIKNSEVDEKKNKIQDLSSQLPAINDALAAAKVKYDEDMANAAKAYNDTVQALNDKASTINETIGSLNAEITKSESEITIKEQTFNNSVDKVISMLNADKAKIQGLNIQ